MGHPTRVVLTEVMKRDGQKWWTAAQLAEAVHGPGCQPRQVAAITKRLGALASEGLVFPSADGAYRLTSAKRSSSQ